MFRKQTLYIVRSDGRGKKSCFCLGIPTWMTDPLHFFVSEVVSFPRVQWNAPLDLTVFISRSWNDLLTWKWDSTMNLTSRTLRQGEDMEKHLMLHWPRNRGLEINRRFLIVLSWLSQFLCGYWNCNHICTICLSDINFLQTILTGKWMTKTSDMQPSQQNSRKCWQLTFLQTMEMFSEGFQASDCSSRQGRH